MNRMNARNDEIRYDTESMWNEMHGPEPPMPVHVQIISTMMLQFWAGCEGGYIAAEQCSFSDRMTARRARVCVSGTIFSFLHSFTVFATVDVVRSPDIFYIINSSQKFNRIIVTSSIE